LASTAASELALLKSVDANMQQLQSEISDAAYREHAASEVLDAAAHAAERQGDDGPLETARRHLRQRRRSLNRLLSARDDLAVARDRARRALIAAIDDAPGACSEALLA